MSLMVIREIFHQCNFKTYFLESCHLFFKLRENFVFLCQNTRKIIAILFYLIYVDVDICGHSANTFNK